MRAKASAPKGAVKSRSPNEAQQLAALCARQRLDLLRAGRELHDSAGPLLSAAGIHLQLLKLDFPAAGTRIQEITAILEQALDSIRLVSRGLASSPVYRGGFHRALLRLTEETAESCPLDINLDYSVKSAVPPEIAAALYDAVSAAVATAIRHGRATELEIQVRDKPSFEARIVDNGRKAGRVQALAVTGILARSEGLSFEIATGRSTIVSIRVYAPRRVTGR